jgi:hypothetical protein
MILPIGLDAQALQAVARRPRGGRLWYKTSYPMLTKDTRRACIRSARAPLAIRKVLVATALLILLGRDVKGQGSTLNMSHDLVTLGIAGQNLTPNNPSLDARPLIQAAFEVRSEPPRRDANAGYRRVLLTQQHSKQCGPDCQRE